MKRFFSMIFFLKLIVQFSGVNSRQDYMTLQCQNYRHIREGFKLYSAETRKHYSAWENLHALKVKWDSWRLENSLIMKVKNYPVLPSPITKEEP